MKNIIKFLFSFIPDKIFLKLKYFYKTGKKLNLRNPKRFNEKIQWLKLYDRNPLYTDLVDKYKVKEYIKNTIGEKYVIPTIGIYDKFEDIDFSKLPNQFVIKCTHDSGGLIICKDKTQLNLKKAKNKIEKCMNTDYYKVHREWPYKNVERKIIIEEYIDPGNLSCLPDYKFFCFNGKVKFMFVAMDRPHATKFNFYDKDFKKIDVKQHYPNFTYNIDKPKNYDKMVEIAEKLSRGINHVRVDLYNIDGKILFGEMTFYHFSGFEIFEPDEYDYIFGKYLSIPQEGEKNEY